MGNLTRLKELTDVLCDTHDCEDDIMYAMYNMINTEMNIISKLKLEKSKVRRYETLCKKLLKIVDTDGR